jgi:methionyl-tRNA formyltransferase
MLNAAVKLHRTLDKKLPTARLNETLCAPRRAHAAPGDRRPPLQDLLCDADGQPAVPRQDLLQPGGAADGELPALPRGRPREGVRAQRLPGRVRPRRQAARRGPAAAGRKAPMAEPLRLVFMGSDAMASRCWTGWRARGSAIARSSGSSRARTRPPGRGQAVRPNASRPGRRARPGGLQPEKLDAGALAELAALRPDISLVVAYGHILRDEFISVPRLGTLNLHASLLPRYRGASPIQAAIASGDSETGMTLMRIVRELDAGPVADAERWRSPRWTPPWRSRRGSRKRRSPWSRGRFPSSRGELSFRAQDGSRASFCRRLAKADGVLDFSAPAAVLAARVNGSIPGPASRSTSPGRR